MSRARWISLGALALVLALLPFVPRGGGGDEGTIQRAAGPGPARATDRRLRPAHPGVPARDQPGRDGGHDARQVSSPYAGSRPGRRPRPVRGLRGPALLPRLGLDRPHPGPGAAQHGRRRRSPGRPGADHHGHQHRRPVDDRRAAPGRTAHPAAARRRADRRAHRGGSLGRQGLAAAPPGAGRATPGALLRPPPGGPRGDARHSRRCASTHARYDAVVAPRPRRSRPAAVKHWRDYPSARFGPRLRRRAAAAPHLLVRADLDADDRLGLVGPSGGASSTGPPSSARPPAARRSPRWSTS